MITLPKFDTVANAVEYTQISVLRNSDAKKRDTNGLLPYKFVWEEVPPILYGADTLLYDPLALFEGKGTFVYQVVDSSAILATSVVHHVSISIEPSLYIHNRLSTYKLYGTFPLRNRDIRESEIID